MPEPLKYAETQPLSPEIIHAIERLPTHNASNQADLLLVALHKKPSAILDAYAPPDDKEIDKDEATAYCEVADLAGLSVNIQEPNTALSGADVDHSALRAQVLVADPERDDSISWLKMCIDGGDYRTLGIVLGYPETAADAYVKGATLREQDLPADIRQDEALAFGSFFFSREHYKAEFEVVKDWAQAVHNTSPAIYEACVAQYRTKQAAAEAVRQERERRLSPESLAMIEALPTDTPFAKALILLVALGEKPVTLLEIESEAWQNGETPKSMTAQFAAFSEMAKRTDLALIPIKPMSTQIQDNRHFESQSFVLGTKETAVATATAYKNGDDQMLGKLLGFPESAIKAYTRGYGIGGISLTRSLHNHPAGKFANFAFSPANYQREFAVAKRWAEVVRNTSPAIYEACLQY